MTERGQSDKSIPALTRLVVGEPMGEAETATGVSLIAAERLRQISSEGYDAAHDHGHAAELAIAAGCYAMPERDELGIHVRGDIVEQHWPWSRRYWKPSPNDRIRELVKAGALIAAAIDALHGEDHDDGRG